MGVLTYFAIVISLLTIISSAIAGIGSIPDITDAPPSCTKPFERSSSSQWDIAGMLNSFAYSSAFRNVSEFLIDLPSSDMATMPASYISPISASSLPFKPFVMAPHGKTRQAPSDLAFLIIYSVILLLSFTGFVLAIHTTVVKPPFTAAIVPVFIDSLYS
ncbi:MAG: hypothetical protein BWX58_01009 [Deltaproteobacteria bacterium ADurb.Bin026]|nr:MAG: hypothetical protein BWX58_01009 [Deltaproteobacteria bacterium ADurb.Bin026]